MVQLRDFGGLGLRYLRNMNVAFTAKLGWRLLNERDALWVYVMQDKYVKHKNIVFDDIREQNKVSNAWRGTVQAKYIVEGGTVLDSWRFFGPVLA